jgi:hypothetical protein
MLYEWVCSTQWSDTDRGTWRAWIKTCLNTVLLTSSPNRTPRRRTQASMLKSRLSCGTASTQLQNKTIKSESHVCLRPPMCFVTPAWILPLHIKLYEKLRPKFNIYVISSDELTKWTNQDLTTVIALSSFCVVAVLSCVSSGSGSGWESYQMSKQIHFRSHYELN